MFVAVMEESTFGDTTSQCPRRAILVLRPACLECGGEEKSFSFIPSRFLAENSHNKRQIDRRNVFSFLLSNRSL